MIHLAEPASNTKRIRGSVKRWRSRGPGHEEKGPASYAGRAKSRGETPKEGDGNGREPLATARSPSVEGATPDGFTDGGASH
jgi:hypothetical protein